MAKVTIVIEDTMKEGVDGLRISCDSDPDFPEESEDFTIAQDWALGIVDHIVNGADEVRTVDPVSDKH